MIYDPKKLDDAATPPPACPCGIPFEGGDPIVSDTDALGATTYWHRVCLTRRINDLIAAAPYGRVDNNENADEIIARLRAALQGKG
jgi:hypothetical protein